jgi:hypothetical protein
MAAIALQKRRSIIRRLDGLRIGVVHDLWCMASRERG